MQEGLENVINTVLNDSKHDNTAAFNTELKSLETDYDS